MLENAQILYLSIILPAIIKITKGKPKKDTWYWNIEPNMIAILKAVVLRDIGSLSHISQDKSWINHWYERNLIEAKTLR